MKERDAKYAHDTYFVDQYRKEKAYGGSPLPMSSVYEIAHDLKPLPAAYKSNPGIPVGKFIPARLNPDGTVSFLMKGKPVRKARNISEGFIAGGVFHPIRHASDYRPEALSGPEGTRARSGARSTTRKKVVKKKATKKRVTRKTAKRKKR